ncbi:MAG TPA: bifunctional DNA primase/polymerase [Actinocrinis sp.]|nr:bifunctional DNA primase/polymerase [Actinocrinis sp.]
MSTTQDTRTGLGAGLLGEALRYATAGVPVVPLFGVTRTGCACGSPQCRRPGKHPRNKGGLTNASTNPDQVTTWWERWPTANIGGVTGVVFDVCDIDSPEGIAAVAPLLGACHGVAPVVRTGSGGWHLLFEPTGLGNRVRFLPGTDWRGAGGYVVLPPSLHATGNHYQFARLTAGEIPAVPPALLAALAPDSGAAARRESTPPVARRTGYGPAALDRETHALTGTAPGGRNHALNRAAFNLGQLIPAGHLTEADATTALTAAALGMGLSQSEAARTIASGLTAGQHHPRTPRTLGQAA